MRARARLFLHRFEKELFVHIDALEGNNQKNAERARNQVRDALLQIAPVFTKHKYMLGEEYSMLDVAITPRWNTYLQLATAADPPAGVLSTASLANVQDFDLTRGRQVEWGSKYQRADGRVSGTLAAYRIVR